MVQARPNGPKTIAVEKSAQADFEIVEIITGLDIPWGLAFLPGGEALITERSGGLVRVNIKTGEKTAIAGVPKVFTNNQGGLLDVALSPNFAADRMVYISYAAGIRSSNRTQIARAQLQGDALTDLQVIFKANTTEKRGGAHFGSRLVFDGDGLLFASIGDGYSYKDKAQDPASHFGKIIRIHADGSVPDGNPFIGRTDAAAQVYSYGHRNPQGLVLHPRTGALWEHEHGPKGGDEINIIQPGENYGWPKATFGIDYDGSIISKHTALPGMTASISHWTPSIAPSGMAFYTGDAFEQWSGDLFVGALAGQHLRRVEVRGDQVIAEEKLLEDLGARIRDVRNGPDGFVYVLTNGDGGRLLQLRPAKD